jgi:RimJ/RimL family protein N-acetyltransferase
MPKLSDAVLRELEWCHGVTQPGTLKWVQRMVAITDCSEPILLAHEATQRYAAAAYGVVCLGAVAMFGAARCEDRNDGTTTLLTDSELAGVYGRLIEALRRQATQRGAELMQAIRILDPNVSNEGAFVEGWSRGGLQRVATLLQMAGPTDATPAAPSSLTFHSYREMPWRAWCELVERTYQGSLDVPELAGRRNIENTLLGYSDGLPEQERWWWNVEASGTPIGCLILTPSRNSDCELTYLGLGAPFRGQGYGTDILRFAMRTAARQKRRRMVLAVDERNKPAISTYLKAGMRVTITLDAWLAPPLSSNDPRAVLAEGESSGA